MDLQKSNIQYGHQNYATVLALKLSDRIASFPVPTPRLASPPICSLPLVTYRLASPRVVADLFTPFCVAIVSDTIRQTDLSVHAATWEHAPDRRVKD